MKLNKEQNSSQRKVGGVLVLKGWNQWLVYLIIVILAIVVLAGLFLRSQGYFGPGYDRWKTREGILEKVGNPGDESSEAKTAAEQYAQARTAPGLVNPGAYSTAFASLLGLPTVGGGWTEVTNQPYDSEMREYSH